MYIKKSPKFFRGKKPLQYLFNMRHDFFSTPVWHIEGAPLELIDELYEGAYKFNVVHKDITKRSNEGGYQTPIILWESFHPEGKNIIEEAIEECDKSVFTNFKVEGWWYNINGKGHWNRPHTHPNCDFAIVLYLTDSDRLLRFISPHHMRIKSVDYEEYKNDWSIDAKKGDILIFPSDLIHYVLPNPREEDRISISMNLQLS